MSVNGTTSGGIDPLSLTLGFLLNFIATLAGAFVALFLTFRHERGAKISGEKEIQRRVISALRTEIEKNFDDVKTSRAQLGAQAGGYIIAIFRASAYQSAVNSGNLSLLNEDIRNSLANIYLNFEFVETMAAKELTMLGTATANQQWGQYSAGFHVKLEERLTILNRDIPGTLELLNREYALLSEN